MQRLFSWEWKVLHAHTQKSAFDSFFNGISRLDFRCYNCFRLNLGAFAAFRMCALQLDGNY